MSATDTIAADTTTTRRQETLRPHRLIVWAVVVVLVVLAFFTLVGRWSDSNTQLYDPQNRHGDGTAALARVIADHGVPVTITRNERNYLRTTDPSPDTSVVITNTDALSPDTAQRLMDHAQGARQLVLVSPTSAALADLGLSADAAGSSGTDDSSSTIVLPASPEHPEVVIIDGELLRNDRITHADNAGVAIRTLAPASRVIWYVPSKDDADSAGGPSGPTDIPRALGPLIALAAVGLLALMLWRGRRFGPLVTEPLPAVVKAIETTQARGRLYHRAGAADRAAATLRAATITRLSRYLGLPGASDPRGGPSLDALMAAVAGATGHDRAGIWQLLAGPLPTTDDDLVAFSTGLTDLEKEVHRTP